MPQLPDFPEYVEQTEPTRQKLQKPLVFDIDDDNLEWTVRDVIEELEYLVDLRATMTPEDFHEEVREQAKRLLR
ncbi:hypothetical protein NSQ24_01275 [Brevibacillus sp. FSL L8-0520]|uniref:hypothetical protein n=1 Tax=Brevibacillus sp. FSL L8-0520 TaxID=2954689 RepID=UPI0030D40ABB